ncbi:MAG: ribonuclease H-like domain-containing protein [Candidatus Zixiibacteriota bacterium]|jgi:uncharacterized protein YprB with RNaseH-like and TPR domain
MTDGRDFRAKLREIARARARGERPGKARPPADSVVPVDEAWPAERGDGLWLCRPAWPDGYPPPAPPQYPANTVVAFDVESLGRTPKPLFLVGFGFLSAEGASFEQYLAGHPDEEGPVLSASADVIGRADVLLSYNGRTFDLPIIHDRLRWWRLPGVEPRRHVDVLQLVRRHYRERLGMPACALGDAERYVLGVGRPDDVPSSQVPELYERFLQIGDGRLLEPVLRHNLYDLAATLLLYLRMKREIPEALEPPGDEDVPETGDLF